MTVVDFIERIYLPHVERELRQSTLKHYKKDIFERHVKSRLRDIRLRDFRTVTGQRLLRTIPDVGHRTLMHVKVFLSSVFKHSKREGILDGLNPMQDVSVPGRPQKKQQPVYTMQEIGDIVEALDGVAFVAVSVAAFTGLRLSEIRGLRWRDFDGTTLHIQRAVWRTHVNQPKTMESEAGVPVLPVLQKLLVEYRNKMNGQPDDYIFAGERRGAPLNLANLARRGIIPALKQRGLKWKGWHSFRRSLASNLYSLGISPKVIAAILRHSDISMTLAYYVSTPDNEAREAMQKIEDWIHALE